MQRSLQKPIEQDALADFKMAFISGPRQVGKTTLAKAMIRSSNSYFNWDNPSFQKQWARDSISSVSRRQEGPIVLDEIHKDRRWKNRLKGLFDTLGDTLPIIVTGSARLDFYRKGRDSLMGRYLPYRLHPLTVGEGLSIPTPNDLFATKKPQIRWQDLLNLGGFPEPLLKGKSQNANRWSRLRLDRLAQEDARDLRAIQDIQAFKLLIEFLPERVGSLLSINSLREDVGVAYATTRDWIHILETLYHCFLVKPYAGNLKRTLKSEPKLYLFDTLQIRDNPKQIENLIALHLLKTCHYWTDTAVGHFELRFVRDKEGNEVDFLILKERKPWMLIECKSGKTSPHKHLIRYSNLFKTPQNIQLVDKTNFHQFDKKHKVHIIDYESFLSNLC